MPKRTITDIDPAGKRVLVRVDFNVPIEGGRIVDDRRIREALPTVRSVIDRGGAAVLMSHLGRPEGDGFEPGYSLRPVAEHLATLLGAPVEFPSNDCVDQAAASAVASLGAGRVALLENLRFHKGEKKGDPALASKLAAYGDVYVNDAFGTAHREDASMVAVPAAMSGKPRVAGLLLEKELRYLGETIRNPAAPFVVVIGGAKVADKIPAIENCLNRASDVLIGGAMAYTFAAALGRRVGDSRVEAGRIPDAKRIIEQAATRAVDLHLPVDHVCSTVFDEQGGDIQVFDEHIKDGYIGLDIGPRTQTLYTSRIRRAKTIVWNGPMGVVEWRQFRVGSQQVARAIVDATAAGATSICGGGDTAAAVEMFGLADGFSHVSTGGGASLEMLAGRPFKSVDLLDNA